MKMTRKKSAPAKRKATAKPPPHKPARDLPPKDWLGVSEAAEKLGETAAWVRGRIKRRDGPISLKERGARRVDGRWYVSALGVRNILGDALADKRGLAPRDTSLGDPRKRRSDATCMAPVGDEETTEEMMENTCDKVATQERAIDGVVFPFCDAHAAECDQDAIDDPSLDIQKE